MVSRPYLDINQTLVMEKLSISNKNHNTIIVHLIFKAENYHSFWKSINKLSRSDLYGGYMGNRYPIFVSLYGI